MSRRRLFVTIGLWAVLLIALNGVVVAYAWQRMHPRVELQHLWDVPQFSLTDQENRTVNDESLRGKVWIADFIFTQCAGSCPMMSSKMAELGNRIKDLNVQFISFSVDPKDDTPAVLKQYASRYNADSSRWKFLTGTEKQMQEVALGMKIDDGKSSKGALPLDHSTLFLLVDGQGQVRGIYDNKEMTPDKGMKQLADDATALAEGRAR
jgi:protein SCO1/2